MAKGKDKGKKGQGSGKVTVAKAKGDQIGKKAAALVNKGIPLHKSIGFCETEEGSDGYEDDDD